MDRGEYLRVAPERLAVVLPEPAWEEHMLAVGRPGAGPRIESSDARAQRARRSGPEVAQVHSAATREEHVATVRAPGDVRRRVGRQREAETRRPPADSNGPEAPTAIDECDAAVVQPPERSGTLVERDERSPTRADVNRDEPAPTPDQKLRSVRGEPATRRPPTWAGSPRDEAQAAVGYVHEREPMSVRARSGQQDRDDVSARRYGHGPAPDRHRETCRCENCRDPVEHHWTDGRRLG
jgi:hypothetical protein